MTEQLSTTPARHAFRTFLIALALFLLFAFAVQATEISLERALVLGRQESFLRVLRLLADPDILRIDAETGRIVLSEASRTTLDGIVETILMALMATTVGTALAVPVSFLAARNLMITVSAPLAAIMTALAAVPIGGWLGWQIFSPLMTLSARAGEEVMIGIGAIIVAAVLTWPVLRLGPPVLTDTRQSRGTLALSIIRLAVAVLLFFFSLGVLAHLGLAAGVWLVATLRPIRFLGNAVFVVSDLLRLTLPALMAFVGAMIAASLGSRYGQEAVLRFEGLPARLATAVTTALGSAVLVYGVGATLNWLYLFDNPESWTTIPAVVVGAVAGILALFLAPKRPFPIGSAIYSISRGILNVLRSIEPLILGIVFVIWVSLGPFAGVMALALHTIAALGKLYSEQVEGITEGPLEAVTATGANRIQTIAYAVIPQIVPPYIAFTLYRWDINVRLATIIGFVGGGGIGLVLSQNIQQLRYQQASVMMIAIAVVVSLLDYVSSKIRSRII